jgi:hypothetical protein
MLERIEAAMQEVLFQNQQQSRAVNNQHHYRITTPVEQRARAHSRECVSLSIHRAFAYAPLM